MKCVVACLQLNSQDDLEANARAVEGLVREAYSQGAQLICLPENSFYMRDPAKRMPAMMVEAEGMRLCQSLAAELGVWMLTGSLAAPAEEGKWFNRSALIDAQGRAVAAYDKIHLFDVDLKNEEQYRESDRVAPGNEAVLAKTPWGMLGLSVCYDLRFPQLYRALAQAGASMLSVPSAFTHTTGKAHWHALLRARAIENGCYVIAPAQCGMHPGGRRTYGHSLVVDPWGEVAAEASEGAPQALLAELDMDKVAKVRAMIPSLAHDRAFTGVAHGE
jgi:predicted amidohydrolase